MKIENQDEQNQISKLAAGFITIPGFPADPVAVDAMASDLIELCADWDEVHWLVKSARRWEKWFGTYGLVLLLFQRKHDRQPFCTASGMDAAEFLRYCTEGEGKKRNELNEELMRLRK